jgi:hypothetical protein
VRGVGHKPALCLESRLQSGQQAIDGVAQVLQFIGRTVYGEPLVKAFLGDLRVF